MFINLISIIFLIVYSLLISIFMFSNIGNMGYNKTKEIVKVNDINFKIKKWRPINKVLIGRMKFMMLLSFTLLIVNSILTYTKYIDSEISLLSIILFGGSFTFFIFKLVNNNEYLNKCNNFYKTIYFTGLFLVSLDLLISFINL